MSRTVEEFGVILDEDLLTFTLRCDSVFGGPGPDLDCPLKHAAGALRDFYHVEGKGCRFVSIAQCGAVQG